jgi:hypothetical protein
LSSACSGDRVTAAIHSCACEKAVVFDRLLVRLVIAAPGRWVLKGALALDFRLGERTRTTKDMDLVRGDNEAAATSDHIAAQAVDLDDFFTFDIEKIGAPGEALEGVAVRYRVRAELGGRRFEEVMVDIGFSDPLKWKPEPICGPDLLAFAGIEPIEVPVLPLEQHIAEKGLPDRLPPPPTEWAVPYRKLAMEVALDPDLHTGHLQAAALLDPVLAGRTAGRWDPQAASWT